MRRLTLLITLIPILGYSDAYEEFLQERIETLSVEIEETEGDESGLYWYLLGQKTGTIIDLAFYRITKK